VRRGSAILAAVLIVAVASYTAFWLYAAKRIKAELSAAAVAAAAQNITVTWQTIDTSGYPFRFRIELAGLHVADESSITVTAPRLLASALVGDFDNWRFALPNGLEAQIVAAPPRALSAQRATGAVSLRGERGSTIWLTLGKSTAETGIASLGSIAFDEALTWLILPKQPPKAATDAYASFAVNLRDVAVAAPPSPFGKTIDDLSVGMAVMGPVPGGALADAVTGWRAAGGSIKLEHSELAWDRLDVTGKGNVGLDSDLQLSGSLAIEIAGYDQLLTALSVAGLLPQSDLTPMKIGLAMIGTTISTDLTVKGGDLFLGPANLGKAPRIEWK
jgi:hypothetical protein